MHAPPVIERRLTLAQLREAEDVQQQVLAKRLGTLPSNVSKIESSADPKLSTLQRYADALGGELLLVVRFRRPAGREDCAYIRAGSDTRPLVEPVPGLVVNPTTKVRVVKRRLMPLQQVEA